VTTVPTSGDHPLPDWQPPARPARVTLQGQHCRIEPLVASRHAHDLYSANALDAEGAMWTYLAYGPFANESSYTEWLGLRERAEDALFFAIVDLASNKALGVGSYMRIEPAWGTIEIGNLAYSPELQRTIAATEAMYLVMKHAFELGYRRYEWKCNARNAGSRRAAERLGFSFEGIFRQHMVYKGMNRDTAWYALLDGEWPRVRAGFERWLDADNFDSHGRQRRSLSECRDAAAMKSPA
jgi:RimJ/RimL family protein N-acetyltransferase